jgi:hypothetical protein
MRDGPVESEITRRLAELWISLRHPFCYVLNKNDLLVYLLCGGHALVDREIAESHLSTLWNRRLLPILEGQDSKIWMHLSPQH